MVEEERSKLHNKVKILKVIVNKEKEQLDKKTIYESDSDKNGLSDLTNKSDKENDSDNSNQQTISRQHRDKVK